MGQNRFSRYVFKIRRGVLYGYGQKRTMRGTNYNNKEVQVPLEGRGAKAMKDAMAIAVVALDNE